MTATDKHADATGRRFITVADLTPGETSAKCAAFAAFYEACKGELPHNTDGSHSGTFWHALMCGIEGYLRAAAPVSETRLTNASLAELDRAKDEGSGLKSELEFLRTLAEILAPLDGGAPNVRRALDAISTMRMALSGGACRSATRAKKVQCEWEKDFDCLDSCCIEDGKCNHPQWGPLGPPDDKLGETPRVSAIVGQHFGWSPQARQVIDLAKQLEHELAKSEAERKRLMQLRADDTKHYGDVLAEEIAKATPSATPMPMFDAVQLSEARYYRNSKDPLGILARAILRANGEMT